MKILLLLIPFLLFSGYASAQKKVDYGVLQKPGEEVIFGFSLKKSNKIVLVCHQKDDKYIVYRFGTKDKAELQYPSVLNAASWKLFRYSGYWRGGDSSGGESPMELHTLSFTNNQVAYKIYDESEGYNYVAGIAVTVNRKETTLVGKTSSKNGTLGLLRDKEDLIHNYYWDEN